jgi:hypothetical protein
MNIKKNLVSDHFKRHLYSARLARGHAVGITKELLSQKVCRLRRDLKQALAAGR